MEQAVRPSWSRVCGEEPIKQGKLRCQGAHHGEALGCEHRHEGAGLVERVVLCRKLDESVHGGGVTAGGVETRLSKDLVRCGGRAVVWVEWSDVRRVLAHNDVLAGGVGRVDLQ
jgi:hypothetical protein